MGAILGRWTTVLVDQWNFSTQLNKADLQTGNDLIDVTPFETAGSESIQGPISAQVNIAGFFKGVGDSYLEKELFNRLAAQSTVISAVLYGTSAVDCPAYVLPAGNASGMQMVAPAKDVITVAGSLTTSSSLKRGKRLYSGTISATGAQAGVDFGAAGANGGFAYLFVSAISGAAVNATIVVESDSDPGFGGAVAEGTFTFSAVGAQQIVLSGVVGRYVRINCTSKGGATSFAVYAIGCIADVSY